MSAILGFLIGYATGSVVAIVVLLIVQANEAKRFRR